MCSDDVGRCAGGADPCREAQAGYEGSYAVWRGSKRSAQETLDLYGRFGLKPVPSFLSGNYWDKNDQASILEEATGDRPG